jgi:phosphatidate cytidylyltransferase
MSRLVARVLTGTTLALVAAGLLWLSGRFASGRVSFFVVTTLALLSAWELDHMGSFRGRKLGRALYPAACACAAIVAIDVFGPADRHALFALFGLYVCALVCAWVASATREGVPLALWLLPPLYSVVFVDRDFGTRGLVILVVLAKIGDNAGYFVGRALGKRHPFPNVSPGKTVAGCVASLVAGIAAGAVILPLTLGTRTPAQVALGALVGGLINVAAQASDLSESWVKRRAGVKDSSTLVGPSGGVLDVIDSLFFASPVALLLWAWIYPPAGA